MKSVVLELHFLQSFSHLVISAFRNWLHSCDPDGGGGGGGGGF